MGQANIKSSVTIKIMIKHILPYLLAVAFCVSNADSFAQNIVSNGLLKVSDNKRFLVHENGKPFYWLGDTAWELFHRLNREEADRYLKNRAEKGFTVIQAVALAELDGTS
jgi:hypothetical protein